MAKSERSDDTQFAVLPYRAGTNGSIAVMLLTSRRTGRRVIPKGWPMIGKKPRAVARTEARQEAGINGLIGRCPICSFAYTKALKARKTGCANASSS